MIRKWSNRDISRIADIVMRAAEKLGWDTDYTVAQTGTYYIQCAEEEMKVIVRVSDHSDVYCNDTLSIDPGPEGVSKEDAVKYLAAKLGMPIPGWVKRNLRKEKELRKEQRLRREALSARLAAERSDRERRISKLRGEALEEYRSLTEKLQAVRKLEAGVDCSKNNRKNKIRKINNKITDLLQEVELG